MRDFRPTRRPVKKCQKIWSSSTANSYTAQARFGTYSGNNYEFEVFGDMKANGDVAATGAFNFSSNSGDVIEYGGSTFMKRLTTNGGTRHCA